MLLLTLRTDKPEAEISLYDDNVQLACSTWQAHRELAETLHSKLRELLSQNDKSLKDLEGIIIYKGPGSFTGLRIGVSVANSLADSLCIPIIGESGEDWVKLAQQKLAAGENEKVVIPEYGAPPHTTTPKH